jgi:hypothetical protein
MGAEMTVDELQTPEEFREAVGALAGEIVRMSDVLKAQGELLQGMDLRIKALTALVDHHHQVLTKLAGLPPRPKEEVSRAN